MHRSICSIRRAQLSIVSSVRTLKLRCLAALGPISTTLPRLSGGQRARKCTVLLTLRASPSASTPLTAHIVSTRGCRLFCFRRPCPDYSEPANIWGVVLAAGSGLSFVRMRWFSECYTRELVLQFIRTCEIPSPKEQPSMQIRYETPAGQTLPAIRILPSF